MAGRALSGFPSIVDPDLFELMSSTAIREKYAKMDGQGTSSRVCLHTSVSNGAPFGGYQIQSPELPAAQGIIVGGPGPDLQN